MYDVSKSINHDSTKRIMGYLHNSLKFTLKCLIGLDARKLNHSLIIYKLKLLKNVPRNDESIMVIGGDMNID